jgi:hypothetical protein
MNDSINKISTETGTNLNMLTGIVYKKYPRIISVKVTETIQEREFIKSVIVDGLKHTVRYKKPTKAFVMTIEHQ